jgi:hypothetical protein
VYILDPDTATGAPSSQQGLQPPISRACMPHPVLCGAAAGWDTILRIVGAPLSLWQLLLQSLLRICDLPSSINQY